MTETERSGLVACFAADQAGAAYIYGATAQLCTIGYRLARAEQYPEYADKIRDACPALSGEGVGCVGCRWDGKLAFDCAQLGRFAARAAGLTLPSGATSQWQDGDWAASGLIGTLPEGHVCFVYRRRDGRMVHTGVYMGDGTVVEARGHADGVIRSGVADYPWTHWAILRGMACPAGATVMQAVPVLRKGCSGEDVARLQEALIAAGISCGDKGADGVFGVATQTAVRKFQALYGLAVDGVAGEMTWARLEEISGGQRYDVVVSGVAQATAQEIIRKYGGRMEEVAT